jgi:hypothetical protein
METMRLQDAGGIVRAKPERGSFPPRSKGNLPMVCPTVPPGAADRRTNRPRTVNAKLSAI